MKETQPVSWFQNGTEISSGPMEAGYCSFNNIHIVLTEEWKTSITSKSRMTSVLLCSTQGVVLNTWRLLASLNKVFFPSPPFGLGMLTELFPIPDSSIVTTCWILCISQHPISSCLVAAVMIIKKKRKVRVSLQTPQNDRYIALVYTLPLSVSNPVVPCRASASAGGMRRRWSERRGGMDTNIVCFPWRWLW